MPHPLVMYNTCTFLCAGWGGWYGSGPPPGGGQISASASDSSLGSTTSYTSAASKEGSEKLLGESQAFHINIKAAVVEWSISFVISWHTRIYWLLKGVDHRKY